MKNRHDNFDQTNKSDCITDLHVGSTNNCSCDSNCCNAFSDWLDHELEVLMERFSDDITHNSLRNSLLRDR